MGEKDLIDVFMQGRGSLFLYWNFYVVGGLALLGWLAGIKKNPTIPIKIIVTLFFVGFVTMNYFGLVRTIELLQATQGEITTKLLDKNVTGKAVLSLMANMSFPLSATRWLHGIVDLIIFLALWLNKPWSFSRQ